MKTPTRMKLIRRRSLASAAGLIVLLGAVLLLPRWAAGPDLAGVHDALPELSVPRTARGFLELPAELAPPMTQYVVLDRTCEEVQQWAGIPLRYLPEPPVGTDRIVCAISGSPDGNLPVHDQSSLPPAQRTGWGIHVFYLPAGIDLSAIGYVQLLEHGTVEVAQHVYGPRPQPAPVAADPDELAGGYAPFDVGSTRGAIQRLSEVRYVANWSVTSPLGATRVSLSGALPADDIMAAARSVQTGVPPSATTAAEATSA